MSESRSNNICGLQLLSKEDLKNLAKMQQKAKRDEEAKAAKTRPQTYAPMGSKVSFDAPVKVSNEKEDSDNQKLMDILGPYDRMSRAIMSGQTRHLMGVEQQPTTPLPSKNQGASFFDRNKPSAKVLYNNRTADGASREKDTTVFNRPSKPNSASDPKISGTKESTTKHRTLVTVDSKGKSLSASQSASAGNTVSSNQIEKSSKSDHRESSSSSSSASFKSSSHQKSSSRVDSANHNIKKETTEITPGRPIDHDRVPVLQSFKKELIGQSQRDSSQSVLSASKVSPSQHSSSKSAERTNKKPNLEPVTVLKESKEENRNALNGKFKNKPRLQIPQEKNVEEMLQELTHIPQPLTGIQTPFKDSKFPFQEKASESNGVRDRSMSKSVFPASAPVKVESKKTIPEEIQEKDDTESSDSGDDESGSGEDDNDDNGDNSSSSGDDDDDEGENGGNKSDEEKDRVEEMPHPATDKIPVPANSNPTPSNTSKALPVKEQRPMASSDSSSSGSESSDSDSDSDSGSDGSDNEKADSPSPEKEKATPPKMKTTPDYLGTSPSPSRQSWNLGAFLPYRNEASGQFSINSKPTSLEAPPSNKSDPDHFDEVIGVKRSADHVSDENPQSVDPESAPKPMSADEFSPPAPATDKQVLSPLKSPQSVKSPSKRTTVYATDKVTSDSVSGKTKSESSEVFRDRYDSIKSRERKKSTSNSGTDSIKEPKQKPSRSHKPKQRVFTPKTVPDDSSSSESDIEMSVSSSSPVKSLPKSPRKSLISSSNDTIKPSSMPSRSSSKKESKQEKLLKEQNSVKLKRGDTLHFKVDCDSSSKAMSNMPAHSDDLEIDSEKAMKDIFNDFSGRKLLSPIAGDSENISESLENAKNVKSEIMPVKNLLNGSVKYLHGKPSVLVQIELNLLNKIMFKDRANPNILKVKPGMDKRLNDNVLLGKGNLKASKVTSAKHNGTDIANKSHQVLHTEPEVRTGMSSTSNHSANNSHISANSSSTTSANSNERTLSDSVTKPKTSDKVVLNDKSVSDDMPDFDSLPIHEPILEEKAEFSDSSTSVGSDSSDSEIEDDSKSSQLNHVSSHPVSFNQSPPDVKKRKLESHRADDSKRRKTSSSKVLHNQSTPEKVIQKSNHDPKSEPNHEESSEHSSSSNKKTSVKREHCGSSSSQSSTLSQLSIQSNSSSSNSKHNRRNAYNQRSHKKAKLADEQLDLVSSQSADAVQSQHKSSPTAFSNSASSSSSSSSSKHSKPELSESGKVNGHIPQQVSSVPRPESDHKVKANSHWPVSFNHDAEDGDRLLSGSEYHKKATSYKHKADAMPSVPHSLEKYIVFLESDLYFLLSGLAREREHQTLEASSLFKDTQRLMAHHFQQFRLNVEPDAADKSDLKFTVLCLRIQSLLCLKLYKLKRVETLKLKKVLDDHHNKSVKPTSQPKPPSAPSPHQTNWNRSTGTPSPMSPTPSPANSVGSVGSVGSDQTPSKMTNGTGNSAPMAPAGSVLVPQRIHSITQKYFTSTNYLVQAHELWDQAESSISGEVKEFINRLDCECGQPTIHSSLLHLVKYCWKGITYLKAK